MENKISKEKKLAEKIWELTISELLVEFRFLDLVVEQLPFKEEEEISLFGMDGENIYYNSSQLIEFYCQGQTALNRAYYHLLLHGLFYHFLKPKGKYWDIACDMAVEYMIDRSESDCLTAKPVKQRRVWYEQMEQIVKIPTAENLEVYLHSLSLTSKEIEQLKNLFSVDDHSLWGKKNLTKEAKITDKEGEAGEFSSLKQQWKKIGTQIQIKKEMLEPKKGNQDGGLVEYLSLERIKRQDYRKFLEKFMCTHEDVQLDLNSFDYIYYLYGLNHYGKMPLIEPLEYRDSTRLDELVIAIDTSESCSGKLVKIFLEETWAILREKEYFFQKFNLHILQCDKKIQQDSVITSKEEIERYIKNLKIIGHGGTDFRPVFSYVDDLCKKKKMKSLKGLIYFTDAYGMFPKKRPAYEVAFVTPENEYALADIPFWAVRIIIERRKFL